MPAGSAPAQDDEALKGVESIKAIFDLRDGNPQSVLVHVKLLHDTYKDSAVKGKSGKPEFAVVFMGESAKLLSKNREGPSPEDRKLLDEMDAVITAMRKDGIRLEICMFAAEFFGVVPKTLLPELNRVRNGWLSSMGYQSRGYSLVPAF